MKLRKATPEHLARMVGTINAMFHKPPVADNIWYYGLQAMGFMNEPPQKFMRAKSHLEVIQGMSPPATGRATGVYEKHPLPHAVKPYTRPGQPEERNMAKGKGEPRHFDAADVNLLLSTSENNRVTITLEERETAWDSTRMGRFIYGPARVEYIRHRDGAVDTYFETIYR